MNQRCEFDVVNASLCKLILCFFLKKVELIQLSFQRVLSGGKLTVYGPAPLRSSQPLRLRRLVPVEEPAPAEELRQLRARELRVHLE